MIQQLYEQLTSLEFWQAALEGFRSFGHIVPVLLSALESVIPPLPLVAIVSLNVAAYGPFIGGLCSWIGTCLGCTIMYFFWRFLFAKRVTKASASHKRMLKAKEWVDDIHAPELFWIAMMPFTPSFFLNFAFGVADYPVKKYLPVLYSAKLIMITSLAMLGEGLVTALNQPWVIILVLVLFFALYYLSKKISQKHHMK